MILAGSKAAAADCTACPHSTWTKYEVTGPSADPT